MHVFELQAPACLPNCFSVVSFVFLCVVVSHFRPHQLILALCNVNCVRTNDLFWVLFFTLFISGSNYLFDWFKSVFVLFFFCFLLETGFPPVVWLNMTCSNG